MMPPADPTNTNTQHRNEAMIMLTTANTLMGYRLHGLDAEVGKVEDFYFDDRHWAIRYLVADTGTWLTSRKVLISPYALLSVTTEKQQIAIDLTRKQIEDSPPLESHKPVSQQFEEQYHEHYGFPLYWTGPYMWGSDPVIQRNRELREQFKHDKKAWDCHLRSSTEVTGYHVQAADGEVGHVEDFIIDDEAWAIRYLLIATRDWWPGKKVLVSPQWIKRVSWSKSKIVVDLSRESIQQSPSYTEGSLPTPDYEAELHSHYNRQGYWVDAPSGRSKRGG